MQTRRGGLLVLSGVKKILEPFPLSRPFLAAIQFQLTLGMTLLRHVQRRGRRIKFKQVRISFCSFIILMAGFALEAPCSLVALWVALAGAQKGRRLVRQNRCG